MLDFPRWKIWWVSLLCLVGIALAVPTFFPEKQVGSWPSWIPSQRINLGLDLAGGSHLLLEADTRDVAKQKLEQMQDTIRLGMRRGVDPAIQIDNLTAADGKVSFIVNDPARLDAAVEYARTQTQPIGLGPRDWNVNVFDQNRIEMTPTQAGIEAALDNAMASAREVVCTRIDPSGTREITCIRQGDNRILVQVPGTDDPEALKRMIGKTARLEFKLLNENADPAAVEAGRAAGAQVLPVLGGGRIAVQRRVFVSGDRLIDARQSFDENGRPSIAITFDATGGKQFAKVTQDNVGKPFAMILDDVVLSYPTIQQAILGGEAQITGNYTVESANELAVQLASGKLPVALTVIEERSVGPDLGKDSIQKGVLAGIVGTAGILIFMFLTYGRFGLYADIALVLNVIVILGIMALFNSTLTLPGIAGFVLTVGAAVDANVIINERIREEQRRGRNVLDSIKHGYDEARTAIFDANITNVIAGILLYWLGSGPVKGFAVVMMIGIATSVFTAVTVTRMFVSIWLRKRPKVLRI
ncbi:MAG TPA: protein translocase subunit SecD [Allosphingosinicella sp.]